MTKKEYEQLRDVVVLVVSSEWDGDTNPALNLLQKMLGNQRKVWERKAKIAYERNTNKS